MLNLLLFAFDFNKRLCVLFVKFKQFLPKPFIVLLAVLSVKPHHLCLKVLRKKLELLLLNLNVPNLDQVLGKRVDCLRLVRVKGSAEVVQVDRLNYFEHHLASAHEQPL